MRPGLRLLSSSSNFPQKGNQMNCIFCQAEITGQQSKNRKYCSKKCREVHWGILNPERLKEVVRKRKAVRRETEGNWRRASPAGKAIREWFETTKMAPCMDCKQSFPTPCMEFDHREGTIKRYNVAVMVQNQHNLDSIREEAAKCDIVCVNCHRIRTRDRRIGNGKYRVN